MSEPVTNRRPPGITAVPALPSSCGSSGFASSDRRKRHRDALVGLLVACSSQSIIEEAEAHGVRMDARKVVALHGCKVSHVLWSLSANSPSIGDCQILATKVSRPTSRRSDFGDGTASDEVAGIDVTSLEAATCWKRRHETPRDVPSPAERSHRSKPCGRASKSQGA